MGVRRFAQALAVSALFIALGVPPSAASASERVLDGGFDVVTACDPSDCTSPVWSEALGGAASVGPLCQAGTGSCGYFQGPGTVGFLSAPDWAQFGGETSVGPVNGYSIQQVLNIPAAPATLRFQLLIKDSSVSTGAFTARIDGTPVFVAGGTTAGYSSYAPVSVDIAPFAGGLRTLRFDATDTQNSSGSSDSFNVDNVSLDAPDHAPAVAGPASEAAKKCPKHRKLKKGRCIKKHKRAKR